MRLLFFFLLPLCTAVHAQITIEYKVILEDTLISDEMRSNLPLKVIMYTNGRDVVLRGIWPEPYSHRGYQLYVPSKGVYYHMPETSSDAFEYLFVPTSYVLLVDSLEFYVAGLPCKLAVAIVEQDTFPVLYTDAFGVQFCQIATVPGFALRYTKRLGGVKLTYEAYKFTFGEVPPGIFSLEKRKVKKTTISLGIIPDPKVPATRQWAMTIGRKPPKLRARSLDRTWINPRFYQGKVVVLHFNALNSIFFSTEPQWFERLARQYAEHPDVLFIMMFRETEMDVLNRMRDFARYRFRIITDADFYMNAMELYTLPATIVINRFNRIGENVTGRDADAEARLKRAIDLAITGGLKPQGID